MKIAVLLVLTMLLAFSGCQKKGPELGGVFYVCSNDPDQERRFLGMSGHNAMQDEAKKEANESCDRFSGSSAIHIVYIYKDGSQKEEGQP